MDDVRPELVHSYSQNPSGSPEAMPTKNNLLKRANTNQPIIIDYVDGKIVWKNKDKVQANGESSAIDVTDKVKKNICCICVKNSKNLKSINDIDGDDTYLNELKMSFKDLDFKFDDSYSSICEECCEDVRQVYCVRKLCEESFQKLEDYKEKVRIEEVTFTDLNAFFEGLKQNNITTNWIYAQEKIKIHKKDNVWTKEELASFVQPYQCNMCSEKFTTFGELKAHKLENHKSKIPKLEACSESKEESDCMILADDASEIQTSFECDYCKKVYRLEYMLIEHTKKCRRNNVCQLCGKGFRKKNNLRIHQRIHMTEKTYQCTLCDKKFKAALYLQRHMLRHKQDRDAQKTEFQCNKCGKYCMSKHLLMQHLNIHETKYSCKICQKNFSYNNLLNMHMRIHTGERPNMCEQCGANFRTLVQLKNHMIVTHTKIKNYKCDICNKEFYLHANLSIHKKVHSAENSFVCEQCGKIFKRKVSLEMHFKTVHEKMRKFECKICDQTFKRSHHLRAHMERHENIRHQCNECLKTFRLSADLATHIRRIHAPNLFNCKTCNKGFKNARVFEKHCCEYCCRICFKEFSNKAFLEQHMIRKHTETERAAESIEFSD